MKAILACKLCGGLADDESHASLGFKRLGAALDVENMRNRAAGWICGACVGDVTVLAAERPICEDHLLRVDAGESLAWLEERAALRHEDQDDVELAPDLNGSGRKEVANFIRAHIATLPRCEDCKTNVAILTMANGQGKCDACFIPPTDGWASLLRERDPLRRPLVSLLAKLEAPCSPSWRPPMADRPTQARIGEIAETRDRIEAMPPPEQLRLAALLLENQRADLAYSILDMVKTELGAALALRRGGR